MPHKNPGAVKLLHSPSVVKIHASTEYLNTKVAVPDESWWDKFVDIIYYWVSGSVHNGSIREHQGIREEPSDNGPVAYCEDICGVCGGSGDCTPAENPSVGESHPAADPSTNPAPQTAAPLMGGNTPAPTRQNYIPPPVPVLPPPVMNPSPVICAGCLC